MSDNYSKIVFGGASLSGEGKGYGFGEITEKSAGDLIGHCQEVGITTFDTAPIYGLGRSEALLGKFLRNNRENVQIITKGGVTWHTSGRVNMSNEPSVIKSMLDQSLKSLNTDYIDTYLIHYPDPGVDIRRALEVVEKARSQGKVLKIGLSNTTLSEIKLGAEVCPISIIQNECNLFHNNFQELTQFCREKNIKLMGHSTLYKGVLSSSVDLNRNFDSSDFRSWAPWWKKSDWKTKVAQVEKFQKRNPNVDLKSLALHFALKRSDSVIFGTKRILQLDELIQRSRADFTELEKFVQDFQNDA